MVLYLPGDTSFTVERNSPLFNDPEDFFQDVIYQFRAPSNPNNDLFFKMAKLIESSTDQYIITGIKFYAIGTQMLSGNLRFAIRKDGYQLFLEPNLYVINSLIKNIRVPEIPTEDGDYSITNITDMETRMLDTCQHPDKYGYIYIPVENPAWFTGGYYAGTGWDYINNFDFTTFQFRLNKPGTGIDLFAASPYFKVSYILKQIAGYLGLRATGSFFTDDETKNISIYHRIAENNFVVMPCMMYMPDILLSDFLKQIRVRMHLAMDIDLISGELVVRTFKSIAAEETPEDLTPFLTSAVEQEVPEQTGYTITLKADSDDPLYEKLDEEGNSIFPPDYTLIAGDGGETPQEIDCSTLKERVWVGPAGIIHAKTNQTVFNRGVHTGGWPEELTATDPGDPSTYNNWQLRLIDYKGYLPVAGGNYPVSRSYNLNQADIDFFKFMATCKRVIADCEIPPAVLSTYKSTRLFGHKGANGNFTRYITEQISYDAKGYTDRLGTQITALTINNQAKANVIIKPYTDPLTDSGFSSKFAYFKAYFDPQLHGINEVAVSAFGLSGDTYIMSPITKSTNIKGAGGLISIMYFNLVNPEPTYLVPIELRIYQGKPKYILHRGIKTNFVDTGAYSTVTLSMWQEFIYIQDFYIIFF